jgi:hypothetical protein
LGTYRGVGIGPDGTLVLESYFDKNIGWSFGSVYDYFMGYRKAYFYLLSGAFGNLSGFTSVGLSDVC